MGKDKETYTGVGSSHPRSQKTLPVASETIPINAKAAYADREQGFTRKTKERILSRVDAEQATVAVHTFASERHAADP